MHVMGCEGRGDVHVVGVGVRMVCMCWRGDGTGGVHVVGGELCGIARVLFARMNVEKLILTRLQLGF